MRPRDWYERDLVRMWFAFGLVAGVVIGGVLVGAIAMVLHFGCL